MTAPDRSTLRIKTETKTTQTKKVKLILSNTEIENALKEYVTRHIPELRNLDLEFDWHYTWAENLDDNLGTIEGFREMESKR